MEGVFLSWHLNRTIFFHYWMRFFWGQIHSWMVLGGDEKHCLRLEKSKGIHLMFIMNLDHFRTVADFQVLWTELKPNSQLWQPNPQGPKRSINSHSLVGILIWALWGGIWIFSEVHIEKPTGYLPHNKKHCIICRKKLKKCSEYSWSQFGNVDEMSLTVSSQESEWSYITLA